VRCYSIDYRSFIAFECEKAAHDNLKIVVLYNSETVIKSRCPEVLRYRGIHIPAYYKGVDGRYYWDYKAIKDAIEN
jgi:hypothetical protein